MVFDKDAGRLFQKMGNSTREQILDRYPPLAYSAATRTGIHEQVRAVTWGVNPKLALLEYGK
jgi:hypothetical protein